MLLRRVDAPWGWKVRRRRKKEKDEITRKASKALLTFRRILLSSAALRCAG